MSLIGTVIANRLLEDMAVAARVGTRVYQLKLPQAPTLPAVRVQPIAEPLTYHLRGPSGLIRSVVQVDAFASEVDARNPNPLRTVTQLAFAIDEALSGRQFTSLDDGSPPLPELHVQGIERDNWTPLYEAPELRLVRIMLTYTVWFRELNVRSLVG